MATPLNALIVEDSEDDALLMTRLLRQAGYEIAFERVETAGAMRDALGRQRWDVVLCDYSLPQFDGLSALSLLKQTGLDIPFIIVSGSIGEETAVRAMKEGAGDYIRKDNLQRLVPAVERELKEAAVRRRRDQAERLLVLNEERYRLLYEHCPLAYQSLDERGFVVEVNQAWLDLLGYKRPEVAGRWFGEFLPPEEIPSFEMDFSRVKETGRIQVERRLRRKDGALLTVEIYGKVGYDAEGRFLQTHSILHDISERRQMERMLRESEDRFRLAFENANIGMCLVDPKGRYLKANRQLCHLLGYSREEIEGMNIADLTHPDDRERSLRLLRRGLEEWHGVAFEKRFVCKDGRILWGQVISSAVRDSDGKPLYFITHVQDITERRRSEEAMQRQNAYLEALHETTIGLMRRMDLTDLFQAIVERATSFARADEGWICIYDPSAGEFEFKAALGPISGWIGRRVPQERGIAGEVFRTDRTVLVKDYGNWPKRAPIPEYDARRATVAVPLKSAGRLAGVLGLAHHDPSRSFELDELAMLERLAELATIALENARLYDQIRLELAERKRLEARLLQSQKLEVLGTLAGGVAHDLNNVLGVLVGYAELLVEKLPEASPLKRYATNIFQSSVRGAAIIQDLLTLARRGVVVSEVIDLNRIIRDHLQTPEMEKLKAYHPNVAIRTELDPDLLRMKGSPVHLAKTIMNLVSNAAEAISGCGEVVIRTENRHLDRPLRGYDEMRAGDYVVLIVSDTGGGISPQDLEKIFEPFYTKKVMGRSGTGLGLTVVWGTVKDHNGYIDVASEEGKGTSFTLYFPATREEEKASGQTMPLEAYMGRGEKILVVDDIKEQRELAVSLLERLGYVVAAAASGEEAVAYLKNEKADLVLLDMIMDPGMDGLDTYKEIVAIHPGQKAVIVSGFSETDRVRQAQAMGAGPYVRKPYLMEKIGTAVRAELDRPQAVVKS